VERNIPSYRSSVSSVSCPPRRPTFVCSPVFSMTRYLTNI